MPTKKLKALAKAGKAKNKNHEKSKPAAATVNKNIKKTVAAAAAIGSDFQTFYKEERFQKLHKGKMKDAIRVQGCEYLGPVQVPAAEVPGAVYGEYYLSPGEFQGTRLELYARLYEKFLFTQMDFEYLPAVGSDTPGQLVIAHDRDISDPTPPANQAGVKMFLSMEDMKAGNVWNPHTARCPLRSEEDGFFCNPAVGGDDRLAYQGQTYVACIAPSGLASEATLGSLLVRYTCEFFIPQLENQLNVGNIVEPSVSVTPTVSAVGAFFDALAWLAQDPSLSGLIQYIPKLQADGTYAITVPEGLFDWMLSLYDGTWNTSANGPSCAFEDVTIEPLEPQPAPAPQPQVERIFINGTSLPSATSAPIPVTGYRAYLNVPRGGARLRQRFQVSGGTGTVNGNGFGMAATFSRLGAVVQSLLNLFPSPTPVQVSKGYPKGPYTWRTLREFQRRKVAVDTASPCSSRKCEELPAIQSMTLSRCLYCESDKPDHFGRDCPRKICETCGKSAPGHNKEGCPERWNKERIQIIMALQRGELDAVEATRRFKSLDTQ